MEFLEVGTAATSSRSSEDDEDEDGDDEDEDDGRRNGVRLSGRRLLLGGILELELMEKSKTKLTL